MKSVVDRLRAKRPTFSVEFFPPKSAEAERSLWQAMRELESTDPAFVSVTYGAGGTSRDTTVRITGQIAANTTLLPVGHLTAVNHSIAELRNVIGSYAAVGITNVLALRGDPPGDPQGEWVQHPEGLLYAEQLVDLVQELGDFCVGVAAYPQGHPRSPDPDSDLRYFVQKLRRSDFAISQIFFEVDEFLRLRDRVAAAGVDLDETPLLPGLMPITSLKGIQRIAELANMTVPSWLLDRFAPYEGDAAAIREAGVELTTQDSQRLLAEGVNALHFCTLNKSNSTRDVLANIGLLPVRS
ncbi:5,10-methylenetetrahydrofolate reductase [Pseudonocardiaceae bacterium YIM PH 21723]|nr:5,10-methylenetetrahydrofolate reductase [Pseudonocardiaceae bacterium YIM PH 21723]